MAAIRNRSALIPSREPSAIPAATVRTRTSGASRIVTGRCGAARWTAVKISQHPAPVPAMIATWRNVRRATTASGRSMSAGMRAA